MPSPRLNTQHPKLLCDEQRFGAAAQQMLHTQLKSRGITDPRTLAAMRTIPRHRFVAPHLQQNAYEDRALPTTSGQTISQPYIVALMTQLLDAQPHHTILEIGAGSGYQAAVLALLAKHVYTVERYPDLADSAAAALTNLNITNAQLITADGTLGLPDHAPFDRILVAAAAPHPPDPLLDQLAENGRLVIPIGDRNSQLLTLIERYSDNYAYHRKIPCRFVPLIGQHAWPN